MPLLPNDAILRIHDATISAALIGSQGSLLAGIDPAFVGSLPNAQAPGAMLLSTLHALNTAQLTDGSVPFRTWLNNAVALVGGRVEKRVFEQALAALGHAASPASAAPQAHTQSAASPQAAPRQKLFVSYSHADAEWLNRLRVHLKPLDRAGKIDFWDDTRIPFGARWRHEIKSALEAASLAVLLVSADFLASDFISSDELPRLLQAEASRGLRIIPVIVSPCLFSMTPILCDYQAANDPRRPMSALSKHEQDEVFLRVAQAIATT